MFSDGSKHPSGVRDRDRHIVWVREPPSPPAKVIPDRRQKRSSLVSLIASPRFSSGTPCTGASGWVSRPSDYTTNISLPGLYSHRSLTFVSTDVVLDVYCTSAETNIRGEIV